MLGLALGAAQLGAQIFGGIKNAREARKQRNMLQRQQQDNQAWYDRRYNEDPTQRADAQRLLTMTQEQIKNRNKAAAGTQAVMGGTDASTAATKEANSRAIADVAGNIAANNEARKDAIESRYQNVRHGLTGQQMAMSQQQQANTAAAIQGVAGAVGGAADALDAAGVDLWKWPGKKTYKVSTQIKGAQS